MSSVSGAEAHLWLLIPCCILVHCALSTLKDLQMWNSPSCKEVHKSTWWGQGVVLLQMLENIEVTLPCLLGIRTDIRLCLIGFEISFEDRYVRSFTGTSSQKGLPSSLSILLKATIQLSLSCGCCVLSMDGQRACYAEYLEQLCLGNPLSGSLTDWLLLVDADSSNDKTLPSLDLVGEAAARLRSGTASGVCNFIAELL